MYRLSTVIILLFSLICSGCTRSANTETSEIGGAGENAVYYWRTTLDSDNSDRDFLNRHGIHRMYLRMFDVTAEKMPESGVYEAVPSATLRISDEALPASVRVVPVVYVTLDALKTAAAYEAGLADKIVTRVQNMCSYNNIADAGEMQLDCDWTASTEESFFRLCSEVRTLLRQRGGWRLSSTIRLHQLRRPVPPVDRGVLMVYNTGNFRDPDAANSIISTADIAPYLRHLPAYRLPLDIAYPAYSWQLLFRRRRFVGLTRDINTADTALFARSGSNRYTALRDVPVGHTIIRKGDIIRSENSAYADIIAVKRLIEARMTGRPHGNIIYHLDSRNLKRYSNNEIKDIFN